MTVIRLPGMVVKCHPVRTVYNQLFNLHHFTHLNSFFSKCFTLYLIAIDSLGVSLPLRGSDFRLRNCLPYSEWQNYLTVIWYVEVLLLCRSSFLLDLLPHFVRFKPVTCQLFSLYMTWDIVHQNLAIIHCILWHNIKKVVSFIVSQGFFVKTFLFFQT